MIKLRDYQEQAVAAAISFLHSPVNGNGIIIAPTGSGKSLLIAAIARQLDTNVLVLQPNREILLQNYGKLKLYGIEGGIYSASVGVKDIKRITFATIGSIMARIDDFDKFGVVFVDEAHNVNAFEGMYKKFITRVKRKVIGLTATPYRLSTVNGIIAEGRFMANGTYDKHKYLWGDKSFMTRPGVKQAHRCIEKFLTRTTPRLFSHVIYNIPIAKLMNEGYLSKPRYFSLNAFDENRLERNSTGMDYDEDSMREEFERCDFNAAIANIVKRLQHPKVGGKRSGILVFTRFVEDAKDIARIVPNSAIVSGDTPKKERDELLQAFADGKIEVMTNANCLTTGYDRPDLDTVVIARPTMSLSLWSQMVGRCLRIADGKNQPWLVDLGGNLQRFGKVEDMTFKEPTKGMYRVDGIVNGVEKPLTNVLY